MTKALYLSAWVLSLLLGGCQQQDQSRRLGPLRAALTRLKDAEAHEVDLALRVLHDLVSKHGNQPADSLLLSRAKHLAGQAREVLSLPGQLPPDTLRQRLQALDRQARLVGGVVPYTRTAPIRQYLKLLAATQAPGDTATALFTGLQAEVARHTRALLTNAAGQVKRRLPYRLRLIPVVRQLRDTVGEGEPFRVEVFPLEIFDVSPAWQPVMTVNGKKIPVENGVGKVRFTVEGPPGRRTWEGKLTLRLSPARDSSFYDQMEYVVLP